MVLWTTFFSLQFQANFFVGEKNLPGSVFGSGLRFLAGSGFNEYGFETLLWSRRYLRFGAGAEIIFIINIYCRQLGAVLRIRIRRDLELLPGSGIIVPDPAKVKEQINRTVNSGLFVLYCSMK